MKKCYEYIDALQGMQLFDGIGQTEMKAMLQCLGAQTKEYKKNEYLYRNEDSIDTVGIIVKGKVQIVREDLWGNQTFLVSMSKGEMVGENFCCGLNHNATVSFLAATNVTAIFMPFSRVMHSCSRSCRFHHRLIENMVTIMAMKNVSLMDKVDIISKKTLREKIATYLMQEAGKQSSTYFEIPLGRVQLAEYLCADRSALTRELNKMKEEGLLDYDKNSFHILKSLE